MKGLRVAGASNLEQANAYVAQEFLPWWNHNLTVLPAHQDDAHRALGNEHDLAAILSHVEHRQIGNGYTVRYLGQLYRIASAEVRGGKRGANLRVEARLDGSLAMSFNGRYVSVEQCQKTPRR